MSRLLAELEERVLLCDGAMGTQLLAAGLATGDCGEAWNLYEADKVERIQRGYVDAGSDIVITNTFGGCRLSLERHGLENDAFAINRAAAEVARRAWNGEEGFVLGDVGPFGGFLEPYGEYSEGRVRAALREQIEGLMAGGVDGIIVETQTAVEEAAIGIREALEVGSPAVMASFAFDLTHDGNDLVTMMGVDPESAAAMAADAGAHVIGINCGTNVPMEWVVRAVDRYRAACDLPVIAQPNAGSPELVDGVVIYRESAAEMAAGVPDLVAAGARIVGGCCGSTPEHITAMREVIDRL